MTNPPRRPNPYLCMIKIIPEIEDFDKEELERLGIKFIDSYNGRSLEDNNLGTTYSLVDSDNILSPMVVNIYFNNIYSSSKYMNYQELLTTIGDSKEVDYLSLITSDNEEDTVIGYDDQFEELFLYNLIPGKFIPLSTRYKLVTPLGIEYIMLVNWDGKLDTSVDSYELIVKIYKSSGIPFCSRLINRGVIANLLTNLIYDRLG